MSQFTITFPENSTIPELLQQLAAESGVTPETLIIRAVAESLKDYGVNKSLENGAEEPTDLKGLFAKAGTLKPGA